jgi:hypothetical protein
MGFEIVFVTGSEISLLNKDFFKEETLEQRLNIISNPILFREQLPRIQQKMNIFLTEIAKDVREFFKGKITYASLPFENVDWNLFDFIATDAGHRSAEIAPYFKKGIQALVNKGKPVAITEFGCCTYHGAAELGARADWIIKWDKNGRASHFDNIYIRDEEEQAQYLLELLEIFDSENVNAVFINTFARYDLPHRTDPLVDLDLASGGIVKVYENKNGSIYTDMPWDPKLAFYSVSNYYRQLEN